MSAITYTVTITGGMFPESSDPMSKTKAIATAREWAKRAGAGEKVFVEWFRVEDTQTGYLNPDGSNDTTGSAWN